MAKNRIINTKFWTDNYILNELNPIDKLLFLYLITNPYTDISGIYELPLKIMAVETGIDKENIEKVILPRFEKEGKILYQDGWIAIKNFQKHQTLNPKVKMGMEIGMSKAPLRLRRFIELDSLSIEDDSLSHSNSNSNLNTNGEETSPTNKETTKIKFSLVDMELSQLLLDLIRGNTPTFKEPNLDKWAENIRLMREMDSRTEEQIRFVLNWCQKDNFWAANILSTAKLRDKFDTLVAQIKRSKNNNQPKWNIWT